VIDDMIDALLPPLFARWIGGWLTAPVPRESHATCDRCAMCAPAGHAADGVAFFNGAIKCCTYLPSIPNFLVGRIVTDEGDDLAEGRITIERRIGAGIAVTPFGLGIPAPYQLLYRNAQDFFGRAQGLRCPHYIADGGRCGIWRHREATCATWFCKHEHGATGQRFWAAMRELLRGIERDLARWCVLALVHDDRVISALAAADQAEERLDAYALDGRSNPGAHRALWGEWAGREREFFVEAGRLVDPLEWNDVLEICGPAVQIQAAAVRAAHRSLTDHRIPPILRLGRYEVIQGSADASTLLTYSEFDPLRVPRRLIDALQFFDGRPTADACDAAARERGVVVTSTQLREFMDFRILLPEQEPPAP
jgi:Fe-S-cluster containining protein